MNSNNQKQIPAPWILGHSKSQNIDYFFNTSTKQSIWKLPDHDFIAWYINSNKEKVYIDIQTNKTFDENHLQEYLEIQKQQQHYNARNDMKEKDRYETPIFHMRNMNNWIKSCLIKQYCPDKTRMIMDFACGKGGDLKKWANQKIFEYVGIDIANESVKDACNRFMDRKNFLFRARFYSADLGAVDLTPYFTGQYFDAISCQFAFHYFFKNEERLNTAFHSISSLLSPGGRFLCTLSDGYSVCRLLRGFGKNENNKRIWKNSICSIEMDNENYEKLKNPLNYPYGTTYNFTLESSVDDCAEYITLPEIIEQKAKQFHLKVVYYKNCQEFARDCMMIPECIQLSERMEVFDKDGVISNDEWEAVQIYSVLVLEKEGEFIPQHVSTIGKTNKTISLDDIISL